MPLLPAPERQQARAIARLASVNPFLEERGRCEEEALGAAFVRPRRPHLAFGDEAGGQNLAALDGLAHNLAARMRAALERGATPARGELEVYREVALYSLYATFADRLSAEVEQGAAHRVGWYRDFRAAWRGYFDVGGALSAADLSTSERPERVLAFLFQLRRAFHYVFRFILGSSRPSAALRAAVWQSIFTHDVARYRRGMFARMHDVTTLVTGPSGTGKELVARAVAMSRYLPFDVEKQAFVGELAFFPLHLAALSPTVIESELFGHKKGAFTGAVAERRGWLAACPPEGTVFLDEIGEVPEELQVKLLRVLDQRELVPLGGTRVERFEGKVVAATNRDLAREMERGAFREDFYYRLCADVIRTPSLRERLDDDERELAVLARFLSAQAAGEEEADALAAEVEAAARALGSGYPWPGNVRELSQCVRNVLVRGRYEPARAGAAASAPGPSWLARAAKGELTVDELTDAYVNHVYAEERSYVGAAERLGIDRRTVRARVAEPDEL